MIETTQNKILIFLKKYSNKIIIGLLFTLVLIFTPTSVAEAYTFYFSNGCYVLDVNVENPSVYPGETIYVSGTITNAYCGESWDRATVSIGGIASYDGYPPPDGTSTRRYDTQASYTPGDYVITIIPDLPDIYDPRPFDLGYTVTAPSYSNCSSPCGTTAHGASCTAYSTSTVPYGSTCSSQERICTDGSLSGSNTYSSCSVDSPANCYVSPWGWINHNSSVTAYVSEAVPYGSACFETTRTCNNGTLSGSEAAYASCSVRNACYPSVDPSGYTNACSATNSCSGTNYGTIQCSGSCSVSAPANPSYYGNACSKSSTYSCNVTNGTFGCAGNNLSSNCSAATPAADPYTPGAACNRNICVGTGTIDNACTGHCSAAAPTLYGTAACYNTNVCGSGPAGAINNCTGACEGAGAAPNSIRYSRM